MSGQRVQWRDRIRAELRAAMRRARLVPSLLEASNPRRAEETVALRERLASAPSLFVEKRPQPGVAPRRRWAARGDAGIYPAIASNLHKARRSAYPRDIEALLRRESSAPSPSTSTSATPGAGAAQRRRQAP